jgi:hypothetical protein
MQKFQKSCGATRAARRPYPIAEMREAYFGWPVAQEDAAERAVRAALAVIESVGTIPGPQVLSTRVGICTGVVVVSEAAAHGISR